MFSYEILKTSILPVFYNVFSITYFQKNTITFYKYLLYFNNQESNPAMPSLFVVSWNKQLKRPGHILVLSHVWIHCQIQFCRNIIFTAKSEILTDTKISKVKKEPVFCQGLTYNIFIIYSYAALV